MPSHPTKSSKVIVASVFPLVAAWRVDHTFDYSVPEELVSRVGPGTLVRVGFGRRRVRAVVADIGAKDPDRDLEPILAVVLDEPVAPPPLIDLATWIARRYCTPRVAALERFVPPRVRIRRAGARSAPGDIAATRVLAYEGGRQLLEEIESGATRTWCFRALAGADRAALIAELASAAGRAGGSTLVGVPEVRYGSVVLEGLEGIIPGLARVDSARSDADRARAWLDMATGSWMGGGGRAVVMTPAPTLRLLLLDEEHHPSLKEDRSPRYDARLVAMERARLQGAMCVLMSATPSVETGHAASLGRMGIAEPTRRDERAERPIVETESPEPGRVISRSLHERVKQTLERGEKVALLVPRRGYARSLWCAACRRSVRCVVCESGMTYDRAGQRIRCGHCGYATAAPDRCPSCGVRDFKYIGVGSERLAEQVAMAWPRAMVRRMDPEVLAEQGGAGEPGDVYVTTWVGTKPVLRPEVSLVAVLEADALIRRPDFRAAESAYEALSEMAAWAGPANDGGRLFLETSEPTHHCVQAVVRADYRYWLSRELEQRAELGYPPFSELIRVTGAGPEGPALLERARIAAIHHEARVLGPLQRRGRSGDAETEMLFKCESALAVAEDLRVILAESPPGSWLRVDVDPR